MGGSRGGHAPAQLAQCFVWVSPQPSPPQQGAACRHLQQPGAQRVVHQHVQPQQLEAGEAVVVGLAHRVVRVPAAAGRGGGHVHAVPPLWGAGASSRELLPLGAEQRGSATRHAGQRHAGLASASAPASPPCMLCGMAWHGMAWHGVWGRHRAAAASAPPPPHCSMGCAAISVLATTCLICGEQWDAKTLKQGERPLFSSRQEIPMRHHVCLANSLAAPATSRSNKPGPTAPRNRAPALPSTLQTR